VLRAALRTQEIFGLPVDYVRLSTRDNSSTWLGTDAQWEHAQENLRTAEQSAFDEYGLRLVEAQGEAAFYAPPPVLDILELMDDAYLNRRTALDWSI
jgi:threonyl-tRNA synthetase